jgi:hypothetical protein
MARYHLIDRIVLETTHTQVPPGVIWGCTRLYHFTSRRFGPTPLFHIRLDQFLGLLLHHLDPDRIVLLVICLGGDVDDIIVLPHLLLIVHREDA